MPFAALVHHPLLTHRTNGACPMTHAGFLLSCGSTEGLTELGALEVRIVAKSVAPERLSHDHAAGLAAGPQHIPRRLRDNSDAHVRSTTQWLVAPREFGEQLRIVGIIELLAGPIVSGPALAEDSGRAAKRVDAKARVISEHQPPLTPLRKVSGLRARILLECFEALDAVLLWPFGDSRIIERDGAIPELIEQRDELAQLPSAARGDENVLRGNQPRIPSARRWWASSSAMAATD